MSDIDSAQDVSLRDEDTGLKAEVIVRGDGKKALAVDTGVIFVTATPGNFIPKSYSSLIPVSVNAGQTITVVNHLGAGKLVHILTRFETEKHEIKITVDGVVLYNFKPKDFDDILKLPDAGKQEQSIYTDTKVFSYRFIQPSDFATSFKVEIKNTDTSSKNFMAHFIEYRTL